MSEKNKLPTLQVQYGWCKGSDFFEKNEQIFLKNALPQRSVKFQKKSFTVTTCIIWRNIILSMCTLLLHMRNGGKFHTFLNSALDGGNVSASL
jgi:hypothetical protein